MVYSTMLSTVQVKTKTKYSKVKSQTFGKIEQFKKVTEHGRFYFAKSRQDFDKSRQGFDLDLPGIYVYELFANRMAKGL